MHTEGSIFSFFLVQVFLIIGILPLLFWRSRGGLIVPYFQLSIIPFAGFRSSGEVTGFSDMTLSNNGNIAFGFADFFKPVD